jgi:hypothetical protein
MDEWMDGWINDMNGGGGLDKEERRQLRPDPRPDPRKIE